MAANSNNTAVSPPRSKVLRLRKCYSFQIKGFLCHCKSCQGQLSELFHIGTIVQDALAHVHAKMVSASMFQCTHGSAGISDSPKLGDFPPVYTSNTSPRFLSKTLDALHLQDVCTLIHTSKVPPIMLPQQTLVPFSGAGLLISLSETTDPLSSALAHVLCLLTRRLLQLVLQERVA